MSLRRGPLLTLLGTLALGSVPGLAVAGTITISISPGTRYADGKVLADVQVSNSGDEPALNVTAVLGFAGKRARGERRPSLAPTDAMSSSLSLDTDKLANGTYPVEVAVDYTDGNQYPFQALHVGLLTVGSPPPGRIAVRDIQSSAFSQSGSASLVVKNLAATPREVTVRLMVPEGIEVTTAEHTVALEAWGEGRISVPIINRTALGGSRLPAFAAAQYDEDGVHYTVVGQGILTILAPQSFYHEHQTGLLLGAAVLVVVWLGFVLWWMLGRSRRAASQA